MPKVVNAQPVQASGSDGWSPHPSVVAVPIIDGSPDYIGWILEQTEQPA